MYVWLFIVKRFFKEHLAQDKHVVKKAMLYAMLSFCENWTTCRNILIASFLEFTPRQCASDLQCDICRTRVI